MVPRPQIWVIALFVASAWMAPSRGDEADFARLVIEARQARMAKQNLHEAKLLLKEMKEKILIFVSDKPAYLKDNVEFQLKWRVHSDKVSPLDKLVNEALNLELFVSSRGKLAGCQETLTPISPAKAEALGTLTPLIFKDLGIYPWSLDREDAYLPFRMSLKHSIELSGTPAHTKLVTIINRSRNATELKRRITQWAKDYNVPLKPLFLSDLPTQVSELRSLGLVPADTIESGIQLTQNNFIRPDVYNGTILNGFLPIGDPHDILTHLAPLLDQRYVRAHIEYSRLNVNAYGLGARISKARELGKLSSLPTLAQKHFEEVSSRIVDWMTFGPARISSLENFSYLTRVDGVSKLVGHGNSIYNSTVSLSHWDATDFIDRMFVDLKAKKSIGNELDLQGFESTPEGLRLVAEAKISQEAIGLFDLEESTVALRDELLGVVNASMKKHYSSRASRDRNIAEIERVFQDFADYVADHPVLRKVYSYESRMKVLEANNALIDAYMRWVERKLSSALRTK